MFKKRRPRPSGAVFVLDKFKKSVDILVFMLALKVGEELIGEKLLSENDLLRATVHEENEKDGSKLRPSHFIFAAFDHGKADSGNAGSVTEFCLGKIKHLAKSDKVAGEDVFIFFDFFF